MLSTLNISSEIWLGDVSISYTPLDSLFTEKLSLNISDGMVWWEKLEVDFWSVVGFELSGVDNNSGGISLVEIGC